MSRGLHGALRATNLLCSAQKQWCRLWGPQNTLHWMPSLLQQSRGSKFQGIKNAREVAADKVKHKIAMTELRKGWTQQRVQETKAHEEAKQIKEAKWKVKVALMAKLRRKQKAQQAALRKKAEVLDAQIKEKRSEKAAKWREAVAICYGRINANRKEELVEASKDWITPETLEQRISMALNNPTKLYEEPTAS